MFCGLYIQLLLLLLCSKDFKPRKKKKKRKNRRSLMKRRSAPFPQCVCSYKLPTPLPLLLQCRGGRRLSQVVFFAHLYLVWIIITKYNTKIPNQIFGQSINNCRLPCLKILIFFFVKFGWNIFIVEFTKKKKQKKHSIPFSEHVFTSHWILNVWLVIVFD
jgi:hypothetical protein